MLMALQLSMAEVNKQVSILSVCSWDLVVLNEGQVQQGTKIDMIKHTVESGLRKRTARQMGGWKWFKCIFEF